MISAKAPRQHGISSAGVPAVGSGFTVLLIISSLTCGFFAGGYAATQGAIFIEMTREASENVEVIDTDMPYTLHKGCSWSRRR